MVLTIELNQSTVNLGNGLKSDKWYLREFDEQAVDLAARHISEWIVPRLVVTIVPSAAKGSKVERLAEEKERASGTPPAGPTLTNDRRSSL